VLGEGARVWLIPPEPSYEVKPPTTSATEPAPNKVEEAAGESAKPEGDADEPEATAEEAPPDAGVIPEEIAKYPAVKLVRNMFADAYSVKKASALAAAYVAEIEAMAKAAKKPEDPEQARSFEATANAIIGKWNTMKTDNDLAETSRTVSRMKKTLESVKGEILSAQAVRQQEARERAEAEKKEAEKERERQELEVLQAKTEGELGKMREKEKEIIPMLKQQQIREATRVLRMVTRELGTKGGLDALAAVEERIKRIEEFHKYMVGKAPGFKSSRGWSIEAADEKTVTVGGKKIPWGEIFESRMDIVADLVNGLVMNTQATKNMRLRERTKLEVNAALCLNMFYNHVPAAVDRAKQIATQAAENFEADADSIKKLMPEFFN
jgi:hypothetical protein